jgi:glutamine amidotransferase
MCLLVVCEPNSTPKASDLHAGACSNPHGYGFAIVADGQIISERSMSAKKSIARFIELREQYPSGYAMWHARYATHGVKNEQNCHPFMVGGSDLTYLAHNGMLDVSIEHGDRRSDTRVFAEDVLPKIGGVSALDDDTIWTMISKWASGNKIAVLTLDPSAKHVFYLINENLGTWDDEGVWWSNASHKRTVPKTYYTAPLSVAVGSIRTDDDLAYQYALADYMGDDARIDVCPMCEQLTDLDVEPDYCMSCEMCFDCEVAKTDCLCYNVSKWKYHKDFDFDKQY